MPATATTARFDLFATITDTVVAALERGTCPWRRPWNAADVTLGGHRSAATGRPYRGVNQILLTVTAMGSGFTSPFWATMRQVNALGGRVRKGSRSTTVVYWAFVDRTSTDAATGERVTRKQPLLRYFRVFNLSQVDGLPDDVAAKFAVVAPVAAPSAAGAEPTPAEAAMAAGLDAYAVRAGVRVTHGGGSAFYRRSDDSITLPPVDSFDTRSHYLATFAHEAAHSTGHASRLNRETLTTTAAFGSDTYGREELVAELAAAFVAGYYGAATPDVEANRDAYLAGWVRTLKADPRAIVVASGQADKAARLIIGETDADDADTGTADDDADD